MKTKVFICSCPSVVVGGYEHPDMKRIQYHITDAACTAAAVYIGTLYGFENYDFKRDSNFSHWDDGIYDRAYFRCGFLAISKDDVDPLFVETLTEANGEMDRVISMHLRQSH